MTSPGTFLGNVVPEIVQLNQHRYANEWRRFVCLNMIVDALPFADLILCRDGLVHFSFADISSSLRQMRSSGAKFLLATTFDAHPENVDIVTAVGVRSTCNWHHSAFHRR